MLEAVYRYRINTEKKVVIDLRCFPEIFVEGYAISGYILFINILESKYPNIFKLFVNSTNVYIYNMPCQYLYKNQNRLCELPIIKEIIENLVDTMRSKNNI